MATSLVGQSIGSTYRQLAHVDGGVDGTEKPLLDGDGTQTPLELSTDNVDISTHNGTNKGLKLQNTLVTASAAEINQLDNKTVGGSATTDITTNANTAQLTNKTIDGGSY
tara:strand:- start:1708 stop:2037 length:330 start_codon:yes stop_codon:yes gene_type:complete